MKTRAKKSDNIFLIGPMGAGKTVIGLQLAEMLGKHFYDADLEIEKQTKMIIKSIFEQEGEPKFRAYETKMIAFLTNQNNIVLSTGGGAVLDPKNREYLSSNGLVIYLKASVKEQLARLKGSQDRPLLLTDDPESKLKELACQRENYYHDLADHVVITDHKSIDTVVTEVVHLYQR